MTKTTDRYDPKEIASYLGGGKSITWIAKNIYSVHPKSLWSWMSNHGFVVKQQLKKAKNSGDSK